MNFAEKLHLVHPLEKKQISLISYAKSDFSVNKNLKREEEASDTDGAAIRTSHTDPKANHLSINYIRFSRYNNFTEYFHFSKTKLMRLSIMLSTIT